MPIYLALGDSMSIDDYTGVKGGGAVARLHQKLGGEWTLEDHTMDGCIMEEVPFDLSGDVVTLTIGGNNLLLEQAEIVRSGLDSFRERHRRLLEKLRGNNPESVIVVGNVYEPAQALDPRLRRLLHKANGIIAENVKGIEARLADIHGAFLGNEAEYLTQVIEPNLRGAEEIARLFHEGLELDPRPDA